MECAVCGERSAVQGCGVCRTLLCEVCGLQCRDCGAVTCPDHRMRSKKGTIRCIKCIHKLFPPKPNSDEAADAPPEKPKRGRPGTPPPASKPQFARETPPPQSPRPAAPEGGSTSFQDLQAELGDLPASAPPPPEPEPERPRHRLDEDDRDPRAEARARFSEEEEAQLNARVLGASGSQKRPMWIGGLAIGGAALLLAYILAGNTGARTYLQPYLSYILLLVALGGAIWNGSGAARVDDTPMQRGLCGLGLVLALIAAGVAFSIRQPL